MRSCRTFCGSSGLTTSQREWLHEADLRRFQNELAEGQRNELAEDPKNELAEGPKNELAEGPKNELAEGQRNALPKRDQ